MMSNINNVWKAVEGLHDIHNGEILSLHFPMMVLVVGIDGLYFYT
jgi:hypothetical protein